MEHITKLFGSDAGFRSHIWLEGDRLTNAGFNPGDEYTQVWLPNRIVCVKGKLASYISQAGEPFKLYHRKVNKQGDNPAIRMEGKQVQKLFGEKFLDVRATFFADQIVIEGYTPVYVQSIPQGVLVPEAA